MPRATEKLLINSFPGDDPASIQLGGVVGVFNDWTEVHPGLPTGATLARIQLSWSTTGGVSAGRPTDWWEVKFRAGVVDIGRFIFHTDNGQANQSVLSYPLKVARTRIPPNTPIEAAVRTWNTGTDAFGLGIGIYEGGEFDADGINATISYLPYHDGVTHPALTFVVNTLDPWESSPWQQFSSGLAEDGYILGLTVNWVGSGLAEYDIGLWNGSDYDVITTLRFYQQQDMEPLDLPALYPVSAGVPIGVRMRVAEPATSNRDVVLRVVGREEVLVESEFIDGVASSPIGFINPTYRDGVEESYAETDLNDPSTYYGGYKAPLVERFLGAIRGLSGLSGQIENFRFGAQLIDTGRKFRGKLGATATRYLTNRPVTQWIVDDEVRRVLGLPRLVAAGYVDDYVTTQRLGFELRCVDWLGKKFSRDPNSTQSWQRQITTADFPGAPKASIGLPAPKIYGSLGLSVGSDDDPISTVSAVELPMPGDPITGFTVTPQAGGKVHPAWWNWPITYQIRPQYGLDEAEGSNFTVQFDETNRSALLEWDPVVGASQINLYVTWRSDFAQFQYHMAALDPSATSFLDEYSYGLSDQQDPTSPWGMGVDQHNRYYMYEDLGGGQFTKAAEVEVIMSPVFSVYDGDLPGNRRRRAEISFSDTTRPKRVIRHKQDYHPFPNGWNPRYMKQFDIAAGVSSFVDEMDYGISPVSIPGSGEDTDDVIALPQTGQVRAIPVGPLNICGGMKNALLIAAHACKRLGRIDFQITTDTELADGIEITRVTDDMFGVSWFAPGHPGWIEPFDYVDINGNRYCLIATTMDPVPEVVLVDVDGVESNGNGSGTLITSPAYQALHFINNYLAPDSPWTSGPYYTAATTTFPHFHLDNLQFTDDETFDAVEALMQERIPGGYETVGIIGAFGEKLAAVDVLARICVSGDFQVGFNRKGQIIASIEPNERNESATRVTSFFNIHDGSFSVHDEVKRLFFNVIPFNDTRDYTGLVANGWIGFEKEIRSQLSIDLYDQTHEMTPHLLLHFNRRTSTQGRATIDNVTRRIRDRYRHPLRRAAWGQSLSGTSLDLGDTCLMDHEEGVGEDGWDGQEIRIDRHELSISDCTTRLDGYDLGSIFAQYGLWAPTGTPDWTAASPDERGKYMFWAATGAMTYSDGEAVKTWK